MDSGLQETLIQEIRALEQFFAALPAHACEFYGLDPDMPLDIKFGPDIESYFVKDGRNVFGQPWLLKDLDLETIDKIDERFIMPLRTHMTAADIIDPDDDEGCDMDGNVIETRFKPHSPLRQCSHYESYSAIMADHAAAFGLSVFPGEGHWHFSATQDNNSCLQETLRERTAQHIVAMQRAFPAFFVKPYIAERDSGRAFYSGPRYLTAAAFDMDSWKSSECSLRFKKAAGTCRTIEPRLNLQAPYQPVFLNLRALKAALGGENMPHNMIDGGSVSQTYNEACAENSPYGALRGQGGYYYLLKETADNLRTSSLFSADASAVMMRAAVSGYCDYLRSGFQEITMPQPRIDEIIKETQDLLCDFEKDLKTPQKSPFTPLQI